MRHLRWGLALCAVGLAAKAPAQANYYFPERPLQWHVEAGYAVTTGRMADFLSNGWTFGTGVTWHPQAAGRWALRADLQYSRFDATNALITLGQQSTQNQIDDGNGQIVNLDFDAVYNIPLSYWGRAYAAAGVGGAWRRIELTQTYGFAGYYCDPWWGYCGGYFPGDVVVAHTETTRLAWNAVLGMEFAVARGQSWFVQARYNRMETRTPTVFVPIEVGFRF